VVVVGEPLARAPSVSCKSRPGLADGDMSAGGPAPPVPRRPRAGCGGTACTGTRAIRSLFPTISVASRPGPLLPDPGAPTCPSPSPRGIRTAGVVGARAGPGGDSWRARVYLHVADEGNRAALHRHLFRGVASYLRETPGWALLLDRQRHRGRTNKSDGSGGVGREGVEGNATGRKNVPEGGSEYVLSAGPPHHLARREPGKWGGGGRPGSVPAGLRRRRGKSITRYREEQTRAGLPVR